MEEGKDQNTEKREQSPLFLRGMYTRINSMDMTTITIWLCGLIIIFLIRDFGSFGFTSFQNLCICFFLILMVFSMVIVVNQTMVYHRIKEKGGVL